MYYLWLLEAQAGPFTLAELHAMWYAGQVTPLTLYWEAGNRDWLPLNNIAMLIQSQPVTVGTPLPPVPRPAPAAAAPSAAPALPIAPAFPAVSPAGLTTPLPPVPADALGVEKEVWVGHPTVWRWTGTIFWGVILSPVLIGLFMLLYVVLKRSSTVYRITNRRVSLETGVFSRVSRELRIQDIREMAARANIFGIGDVEFSSAAQLLADVVFTGVPRVAHVRDIVKGLQNSPSSP